MKISHLAALLCLCLCLASTPVCAQRPATEAAFAERLKSLSASTKTIECGFTLTRTMSFIAEDVVSRGEFYYLGGVGISLDFTDPAGDEITMGRDKFRIVSGGKTTVVRLDSNPMLEVLKRMLTACMTGDVETLEEGSEMTFIDNGDNYMVEVVPVNRRAKGMMKLIALTFDKKDMTLAALRMEEASGDVSEYRFFDKTLNGAIDEARFEIK